MATSSETVGDQDEFSNTLNYGATPAHELHVSESPTFDEEEGAPPLSLSINHLADIHGWFYGVAGEQ